MFQALGGLDTKMLAIAGQLTEPVAVACGYGDLEETNTSASCRSVNSCEVSSIFWCLVFETDQLHSRVD